MDQSVAGCIGADAGQSLEKSPVLRIVIQPRSSGRKWIARLGDRVICVSATPFIKSARLLLNEGYPPDAVIEMWRPDADEWALRGRLGTVAATVIDGEKASQGAKNGCSVVFRAPHQPGMGHE